MRKEIRVDKEWENKREMREKEESGERISPCWLIVLWPPLVCTHWTTRFTVGTPATRWDLPDFWRRCRLLRWLVSLNPTIHFWHRPHPCEAHPPIYHSTKFHGQWSPDAPLAVADSSDHGGSSKNLISASFQWHLLSFPTNLTSLNPNPRSFSSKSQWFVIYEDIKSKTFPARFRPSQIRSPEGKTWFLILAL